MVIKKVNLDIVIGVTSAIPDTQYPEVAFAGKSNVGKSSLIYKRKSRALCSGLFSDLVIASPKNLRQRVSRFFDTLPSTLFAYKPPCSEVV